MHRRDKITKNKVTKCLCVSQNQNIQAIGKYIAENFLSFDKSMKIWNPKKYYYMFQTWGKKTAPKRCQKLESQTLKDTTSTAPTTLLYKNPREINFMRWLHNPIVTKLCQKLWDGL